MGRAGDQWHSNRSYGGWTSTRASLGIKSRDEDDVWAKKVYLATPISIFIFVLSGFVLVLSSWNRVFFWACVIVFYFLCSILFTFVSPMIGRGLREHSDLVMGCRVHQSRFVLTLMESVHGELLKLMCGRNEALPSRRRQRRRVYEDSIRVNRQRRIRFREAWSTQWPISACRHLEIFWTDIMQF